MKRLYIAGAYSSDNILGVLDNIRTGIRAGTEAMLQGYAPFVPWLDFQFHLMLRGDEMLSVKDYQNYSLEWLKVCHAMWVLPGHENSKGTAVEIKLAEELGIPIYYRKPWIKEGT